MRIFTKVITVVAVLAMLLSTVVPAFAVAEYPDLEGHWAKNYMLDLVERGIIAGYPDGEIRPDKTVSAAEAFIMLANLYKLNDKAKNAIYKDYAATVEKNVDKSVNWAYNQISICLAAGILTEAEMKTIDFSGTVKKEDLAVFMVRAVQKADEAAKLSEAELEYKDAADISAKAHGSVALLTDMGIVGGDNAGNFAPESDVSRAVFSTMLCNILTNLEKGGIELTIDGYLGLDSLEGTLTAVKTNEIVFRGSDGLYYVIPRDKALKTTVNGTEKAISSEYVGLPIKIEAKDGKAVSAVITKADDVSYRQGLLHTLTVNVGSIKITDLLTGEAGSYVVSSAKVTQDGQTITFDALTKGAFVTLKIEKNSVTEVTSDTRTYTVTGTITGIEYAGIVTMTIDTGDLAKTVLYLPLNDMPVIKRGAMTITVDRLNTGDTITATVTGGEVTAISTKGQDASAAGTLTRIVRTIDETTWTIQDKDGKTLTYPIDSDAAAFSAATAIKASTIEPGDEVAVVVTSGVITEVTLTKSYLPSSDSLTAEILAIDATNRVLTVLKDGKLLYINCKKAASIVDIDTGKTVGFSALTVNSVVRVYGSYANASTFEATSVIVEQKN